MRIMIKGGVWKNTEDEILKAAVMKYGMNQWARVASLLSRKSAKQCKARWYEWLDPSIKKTEWSREEEEKLLHLAKLMPSQWRTIAPIVGRTAAQCMEHYERLLDAAQQQQQQQGATDGDGSDDPRRLRPGEIDPNPETKPARPDPIDMDEDEKEMLSEARARLANTKGKKAKRKAREKQLEEARRLAALQKPRELKAAGLTSRVDRSTTSSYKKKRKFIDYSSEIPFQKDVPAGFFDVSDERQASLRQALNPKQVALQLNELEGQRRDDQEKKMRQQDEKRQKSLMKSNLPQVIAAVNEKNDPIHAIKRKPLQLPEPVVSNDELADLAKLGMSAAHAAALALEGGSNGAAGETRALLGNYSATPLPRHATPATSVRSTATLHDTIMQEAANLAAMNKAATPLLGGENVELYEGTGYSGATPARVAVTGDRAAMGRTPSVAGSSLRTPLRDELGINPEQLYGMGDSARAEKARARRSKNELLKGFESLPAPTNEYEISVPLRADDDDDASRAQNVEEDAGDRDARLERQRQLAIERELRRRSQAVQQQLPRPTKIKRSLLHDASLPSGADDASSRAVAALVAAEMQSLIAHDIVAHPVPDESKAKKSSSKKRKKDSSQQQTPVVKLQAFSDDELEHARNMVHVEANLSHGETTVDWSTLSPTSLAEAWNTHQAQPLRLKDGVAPDGEAVSFAFATEDADRLRALRAEFAELKETESALTKRAQKLEDRIRLVTGGLVRRSGAALKTLVQQSQELQNAVIEQACFDHLASLEAAALRGRVARLATEIDTQQLTEVRLQQRYAQVLQTAGQA
ncbi:hypothetical protein ATCC90586_000796 [Pythium insidiosum]|nr:hypothetical protein ATCC90586_000796 [Pythium insidiosum]